MANKKFSEFELKTTTSNVSHIVGYNGAENVRITPANFISGSGGPFLPLTGGNMTGNTTHNDNIKSIYGTANDGLEIYHDGSNSYIAESGTGLLNIFSNGTGINLLKDTGEFMAEFVTDGAVSLFYDNSKKFETTNTGISVTGDGVIENTSVVTSDSVNVLDIKSLSSGVITAGFGVGVGFFIENSVYSTVNEIGRIEVVETSTTNIDDKMIFYVKDNNNLAERLSIDGDNSRFATNVFINSAYTPNSLASDLSIGDATATDKGISIASNSTGQGSIFFADETNNDSGKLQYFHSNNSMQFFTNRTLKMLLDASGNLGIGTSTVNFPLTVYSDTAGSTSEFVIVAGKGNDAAQFTGIGLSGYIANNGAVKSGIVLAKTTNFGVGNLHFLNNSVESDVNATLADSRMNIDPNGIVTVGNRGSDLVYDATAYQNDLIVERKNTDGDNQLATLRFNVTGYSGQTTGEASIGAVQTSNASSASLVFGTRNNGTRSEKMRIDSAGNVGIGTVSPTEKLTVVGGAASRPTFVHQSGYGGIQICGSAAGSSAVLLFSNDYNNTITPEYSIVMDGSNDGLAFVSGDPNDIGTLERMRIDSSGFVGIGTATPNAKLEVAGTTNAFGNSGVALQWGDTTAVGALSFDGSANPVIRSYASKSLVFETNGAIEKMRLNDSGVLGIGTTGLFSFGSGSQSGTFIQQSSYMGISIASGQTAALILRRLEDGTLQRFYNSNSVVGSISVAGSATAYNTSSDYRLKEDLQDFKGLDLVSKIPVYDYKWKADKSRSYGVMAHELEEVLPQAVTGDKDAKEMQSVDYSKIVPLLVKSIQELKAEIELLKNK